MIGKHHGAFFLFVAALLFICSSGQREKAENVADAKDNETESKVNMRYMQPYSNPQRNSFLSQKLTASGALDKKVEFNPGNVQGAARFVFLLNDDLAVIDYETVLFVVNIARGKSLGFRSKSPNSFIALDDSLGFYFVSSNQLAHANADNFKDDIPDYFVPGLGQYSELYTLAPQKETFIAGVQNLGNPKYPERSFSVFEKSYPALSNLWEVKIDGDVIPPPVSDDGRTLIVDSEKLSVIDIQGKTTEVTKKALEGEFSPIACSIGPDGFLYLVCITSKGSYLQVYDLNLEKKQEMIIDKKEVSQPPIIDRTSTIYLTDSKSISAYQNGKLIWETQLTSGSAAATSSGNNLLLVSDGPRLVCLDHSGAVSWSFAGSEVLSTPPVIDSQGRAIVASDRSIFVIK